MSRYYSGIIIEDSRLILNLTQDYKINVLYKYDGVNISAIDFASNSIILINSPSNIYIPLNDRGVGYVSGLDHRIYNINALIDSKEVFHDMVTRVLNFEKSYKLDFRYSSSYVDLELDLLSIEKNIKIFPNPTNGYINIEAKLSKGAIIRIYDMKGSLVLEKILLDVNLQNGVLHGLDLSALNVGIYNLLIIDGETKISRRVIKQ